MQFNQEQLIKYLAHLVALPTVYDNYDANHQGIEYLANFFSERGLIVSRYEWDKQESLVATTRPTKTPTVMLVAHLDVVAAQPQMYKIRRQGGKLFGRGVLDMKSAIAAYMVVVDSLKDRLAEYDFGIMITTDEEPAGIRGTDGVELLIKEGYKPQVAIIPDGGDNWQMETSCKGYLHYTLEARGKSGHGSRPWLSDNAAYKIMDALHELRRHFEGQGPHTSTINVGVIQGGEAPNKVPDFLSSEIDVRPLNLPEVERLVKAVPEICAKHGVEARLRLRIDPIFNSLDNPYLAEFAKIITTVTGVEVKGMRSFGASDARYFAALSIPCAVYYPEGGYHHGDNEWISEEALMHECQIIKQYVQKIARQAIPSVVEQTTSTR